MEAQQKYHEGLKAGQVEERISDRGIPEFIIEDSLDVNEFAVLAKAHLEMDRIIAHDFTSHVYNQSRTESASFDYKSGWPLEGLGGGGLG